MSMHPGTGRYNPAGNSDFTRKAEALALGITQVKAIYWPTPAAQNWKGSSPASVTRADGKSRMDILHYRAEQGFTHPDPSINLLGLRSSHHAPISRPLWAYLIALHGRVVSRRILKARARRRLNPLFVGWLMGWP
ncbi:MAG: DNA methyltransferase, partial [Rhodobacterales bacterium]|nr:DNA methyltransferase [Rhodobacterales bacterium]